MATKRGRTALKAHPLPLPLRSSNSEQSSEPCVSTTRSTPPDHDCTSMGKVDASTSTSTTLRPATRDAATQCTDLYTDTPAEQSLQPTCVPGSSTRANHERNSIAGPALALWGQLTPFQLWSSLRSTAAEVGRWTSEVLTSMTTPEFTEGAPAAETGLADEMVPDSTAEESSELGLIAVNSDGQDSAQSTAPAECNQKKAPSLPARYAKLIISYHVVTMALQHNETGPEKSFSDIYDRMIEEELKSLAGPHWAEGTDEEQVRETIHQFSTAVNVNYRAAKLNSALIDDLYMPNHEPRERAKAAMRYVSISFGSSMSEALHDTLRGIECFYPEREAVVIASNRWAAETKDDQRLLRSDLWLAYDHWMRGKHDEDPRRV